MTGLSRRQGPGGLPAVDVLAAEWLLRTVRSTWYVLAVVAVFVVLARRDV
ncbi:hypothetical protein OG884_35645 [Streptosporangium sp. NBC_01755]|nr:MULTISPECIES: hypothetical protein [unclassified Streptosporangium]WSA28459.1 hypothetical protein OIE13_11610 [Streptosporangium sp. NBC_01810]WSD00050.1 hypothetical protein OG884_35645 [Streptosporangium sp. NBC_01755]